MTVGDRLREERERLGWSQTFLGDVVDVVKQTVIKWEKNMGAPDAQQLAAMALNGFDVRYIITGDRSPPIRFLTAQQEQAGYKVEVVTKEEHALLDNYRHAPDVGKKAVDAAVAAVAQPMKPKRRPSM
jgi:transcriptional regulator with XRE-family HTH domain